MQGAVGFELHIELQIYSKKFFLNRLRIDRIKVKSLWPRFLAHAVYLP